MPPFDTSSRHTWRHDFGRGLRCTATLADGRLTCEWSASPPAHNRGFQKAYARWMAHLTSQAAEVTGKRVLQAVQTSANTWTTIMAAPSGQRLSEFDDTV